jgi:hypothetical protein
MKNVLIANNTFVNSIRGAGVVISQAAHVNVRFENNIVEQDDALPVISASTNVTYAANLWSKNPGSTATGPGDYVGDPRLSKSGSPFAPAWYQPADGSSSVDTAKPLSEVTVDYFGNLRSSIPDKGAIEKSGNVGPTAVVPTATATRWPATATPVVPTATKAVTATAKPPEVFPTATVPSWPPRHYRIMIPIVYK